MLCPDDAMNGFTWSVTDGAPGEGLLVGLGLALVALGHALLDHGHLSEISGSARLYERDICGEAHPVDVVPGGAVVQSVEAERELLEEVHAVLRLHDGVVVGHDVAGGRESQGGLLGDVSL